MSGSIKHYIKLTTYLISIWLLVPGCQPNVISPNPFDQTEEPEGLPVDTFQLASHTLPAIYEAIFKPTCANAGCHDGSFEPDFRTIGSAYNTLVYHPVIKNDSSHSYTYRVVPAELEQSLLWTRLTKDIDGQSGIMPLIVDPDNDWKEKRQTYLSHIRKWIEAGAPDMFGNIARQGNLQPYVQGMLGEAGNKIFRRDGTNGAILVPSNIQLLNIWVSVLDDQISQENLPPAKLKLSTGLNNFDKIPLRSLPKISPLTGEGFSGNQVTYYHKVELDMHEFPVGAEMFLRVYIEDPSSKKISEIPNDNSPVYLKQMFSFKRY